MFQPVFELPGGLVVKPPNCFLNPPNTVKLCTGGSAIYCIHTIYITILFGLRLSNSSTPQLIFHNSNTGFNSFFAMLLFRRSVAGFCLSYRHRSISQLTLDYSQQ